MENHNEINRAEKTHNTARFFVEQRQVAWVLLIGTMLWGVFGYWNMPQRKDPDIPVREAMAIVPWPGMPAEKIEQLVTKKVETTIAQNTKVVEIRSVSRTGSAVVYMKLDEKISETGKEFDDIKLKLDALKDLPDGAGPIDFVKDFGDTAALMLTVASPIADEADLDLRSREIRAAIERSRGAAAGRFSLIVAFPRSQENRAARRLADLAKDHFSKQPGISDVKVIEGSGFVGLDGVSSKSDTEIQNLLHGFAGRHSFQSEMHPDTWTPMIVRELAGVRSALGAVAGDKYSYREMDALTEQIEKSLKTVPQVSKVSRSGVVDEQVELVYSQERLASHGISGSLFKQALNARNIAVPGGLLNAGGRNLAVAPSGEFRNEREIGDVLVVAGSGGQPAYVRDLVEIYRGYATPSRFHHYYTWRDANGKWRRSRAITLDVQMRAGEQIGTFAAAVDANLESLRKRLPSDLVMARTSDQPLQVKENVDLFMSSLWEAIILVVLVSLVGFWEWRSAALMAISIPITLAMTFGMMQILGVDLQQVSIASLIIALGLLVDDPVVAGDAIKRDIAAGHPRKRAAWWGPTKLAHAILYATITNIVAYLPFLLLSGDTGRFIYTLPVVITCSLVASRLVSMTFIPMLGYYLLRGKSEPTAAERRTRGFAAMYYRLGGWAIDNRWKVLAGSFAVLALGLFFGSRLKPQFFPQDLQYLAYIDVWLPEDAPLTATQETARRAEELIQKTAGEGVLESITSWAGGGGPRFWFSAAPEPRQLNYAQILLKVRDKHETGHLLPELQRVLSTNVPNARVDVRPLETGPPVGVPVSIRLSGDDLPALRGYAARMKQILRDAPASSRVRDDWGEETLALNLQVDPNRANLAGISNYDVATASLAAFNGVQLATLRDGDKNIPIVGRLRLDERSQVADFENLYVHSQQHNRAVPLRQVATLSYEMQPAKLRRLNQFRTITVSAFPAEGFLPSELLGQVMPAIVALEKELPPGMRMEIAGEYKEQVEGFQEQVIVLAVSVVAIFVALVMQFKHAVKPLIVFAAIPYGIAGSLAALYLMGTPFGMMAFLGIISLVGVIVSHIIVLFDFIEERHHEGAPLREALLDAGIVRLRPVLITVGATVIALFPLAAHGGPLWEPLCYAQIGGLTLSTVITLLLVPVVYAIFVLDLKWVKWEREEELKVPSRETVSPQCAGAPR
ncbi:MAG: efflux RND transporter permease subunit [Bryobacteraceae bacterium]|nr:efflux RND transporter permease subunit [Bryobacteraceae bacterium]